LDWFARKINTWQKAYGRHDLPWQQNISAYRVWLSEIMLQQTQVETVKPYFIRFLERYPEISDLACASTDDVLALWTGLGYYNRARNLHKTSIIIHKEYQGTFPTSLDRLIELPGIGRSTAGAILALSMGKRGVILDGNVKRVLSRFHFIAGYLEERTTTDELWRHADRHTPAIETNVYTQGIMDLGATICKRSSPACSECPLMTRCGAHQRNVAMQIPRRKPKRKKPVKDSLFFIICNEDKEVIVEKRGESGVWPGLWSPPERCKEYTLGKILEELNLHEDSVLGKATERPLKHSFTHFQIKATPIYVRVRSSASSELGARFRWINSDMIKKDKVDVGMSALALKLIKDLSLG
jgi:A/G-specific adenine glycosylase